MAQYPSKRRLRPKKRNFQVFLPLTADITAPNLFQPDLLLSLRHPLRKTESLSRPPLDKLLQILHRRNAQHEPPILVRDDRKLLLPLALGLVAAEEGLELLEGRLHGDDAIGAALALEARHGGGEGVLGLDATGLEEGLQVRDGDVAEEGAGLGVDDGEVGVFALEGGEEGEGDCVGGVEGEGGGGVEVLYCGLFEWVVSLGDLRFCDEICEARLGNLCLGRTPRYLEDQDVEKGAVVDVAGPAAAGWCVNVVAMALNVGVGGRVRLCILRPRTMVSRK